MRTRKSMLPPGGTEMTTRIVLPACDHAGRSGTAVARPANARAPIARARSFRICVSWVSARPTLLFSRVLNLTALPDAGDPLLGAPHDALQSAAAGRLAPLLDVLATVSTIRLRDRRDQAQRTGNDEQSQSHRPSSVTCPVTASSAWWHPLAARAPCHHTSHHCIRRDFFHIHFVASRMRLPAAHRESRGMETPSVISSAASRAATTGRRWLGDWRRGAGEPQRHQQGRRLDRRLRAVPE